MKIDSFYINHLKDDLNIANVYGETPDQEPDEYYIVSIITTKETNHITTISLSFRSVGLSKSRVSDMNASIVASVKKSIFNNSISAVKLKNGYYIDYSDKKKYGYQSIFDVSY